MNPLTWLTSRRRWSAAGVTPPANWAETKRYLGRIVGQGPNDSDWTRTDLRYFIEHAFSDPASGRLTSEERAAFVSAIEASERGDPSAARLVPDVADAVAQERFGLLVFNVVRMDIGGLPSMVGIPLTTVAYTDRATLNGFRGLYEHVSPGSAHDRVHDLTEIAAQTSRLLGQLGAFVPSHAAVVANGPIALEDIVLIPGLMADFANNPRLLVMGLENRPLVLLAKKWWHWGVVTPLSFLRPGEYFPPFPDAVHELVKVARQRNFEATVLPQPPRPATR